jgi:hypothetical protein
MTGWNDRCTCQTGRDHDGSEFGPCAFCEREETASRLDAQAAEITALRAENKAMKAEWAADLVRAGNKRRALEAERDALAARLAVPGDEEMDALIREYRADADFVGNCPGEREKCREVADALTTLRARVAGLEVALTKIAAPGYGLQGIQEDYGHDTNAYNYHAGKYFTDQYFGLQKIARAALSPSAQEAPK